MGKYESTNIHKKISIPKRQLSAPHVTLERVRNQAEELIELWSFHRAMRFVTEKSNETLVYELNGTSLPCSSLVGRSFNDTNTPHDYHLVKGVTSIRAPSLQHVMEQLSTKNSDQFECLMQQLFGRLLIRAVILPEESQLGVLVPEDNQYTTQQMTLRLLGSMKTTEYNFTFVSYQDFYQRSEMKNDWVRLGKSRGLAKLQAPTSSSFLSSKKIVGIHLFSSCKLNDASDDAGRLNFRNTGFIVEETTEPRVFRVSMFVSIEPNTWTSKNTKKLNKFLYTIAGSIGNLKRGGRCIVQSEPELEPEPELIHTQRQHQVVDLVRAAHNEMSPSTNYPHFEVIVDKNKKKWIEVGLLSSKKWQNQPNCRKCQKAFHTFRRCHHCRFCGLSICQKCSSFITLSRSNFQMRLLDTNMGNRANNTNGINISSKTSKSKKPSVASETNFAVDQATYANGTSMNDFLDVDGHLLVNPTRGCIACVSELKRLMVETKQTLATAFHFQQNDDHHVIFNSESYHHSSYDQHSHQEIDSEKEMEKNIMNDKHVFNGREYMTTNTIFTHGSLNKDIFIPKKSSCMNTTGSRTTNDESMDRYHFTLMSNTQPIVAIQPSSNKYTSQNNLLTSINNKNTHESPIHQDISKHGKDMILLRFFSDSSSESNMIGQKEIHDLIPLNW